MGSLPEGQSSNRPCRQVHFGCRFLRHGDLGDCLEGATFLGFLVSGEIPTIVLSDFNDLLDLTLGYEGVMA